MSAVVLAGLELFPGAEPASILPPDAELPRSALVRLTRATLLCPGASALAVSPSFYLKAQISESQEVILNSLSPQRPSSSLDLAFHADSSPLFSVVGGDEIKGKERERWSVHLSGFVEVEEEEEDDDDEDGEAGEEEEEADQQAAAEEGEEDELEADDAGNGSAPRVRSLNGAGRAAEEEEDQLDGEDEEEEMEDDDDVEAPAVQTAKKKPQPQMQTQPQQQQPGKRKAASTGSAEQPAKQQKTAAAPSTPADSSAAAKQQQKQTAKRSPAAAPSSSSSSSSAVPVTFPNGLQVTEEAVGSGAAARTGQRVSIRYTGRLQSGRVFDSNMPRGAPFHFTLGAGECIRGFDLGLKGMRVGGRRRLSVPAELGYGKKGSPPDIPPNSRLDFTVELLKVK